MVSSHLFSKCRRVNSQEKKTTLSLTVILDFCLLFQSYLSHRLTDFVTLPAVLYRHFSRVSTDRKDWSGRQGESDLNLQEEIWKEPRFPQINRQKRKICCFLVENISVPLITNRFPEYHQNRMSDSDDVSLPSDSDSEQENNARKLVSPIRSAQFLLSYDSYSENRKRN